MAWYHHFTHIACAKMLRGLWQNMDPLRVQNGQSLSKYQGFRRKLVCYKGISFFNLFQLQTFCAFSMHHSRPCHQFSTISDLICYFSCIYWFFWAKWPWNWKALQITIRKGWKLAWYLHFSHIACAKKLRGLRQKLDALRVQNGQSLSKYQGFRRKLVCYKGISFF